MSVSETSSSPLDDPGTSPVSVSADRWNAISSARRIVYGQGQLILRVGQPIREVLLGLAGEIRVMRGGVEPVIVASPFLIDRWMADSFGQSHVDAVAHTRVSGVVVATAERAQLLGSIPALREVSVRQRALVMGERDHLPQSSRSSM